MRISINDPFANVSLRFSAKKKNLLGLTSTGLLHRKAEREKKATILFVHFHLKMIAKSKRKEKQKYYPSQKLIQRKTIEMVFLFYTPLFTSNKLYAFGAGKQRSLVCRSHFTSDFYKMY